MYVVYLTGGLLVSSGNNHGFRAVVDVGQWKDIAATDMKVPLADRQAHAI
jgi:hypothetical protein